MGPIDFVLIVLIFGEFFLFLAIVSYSEKRREECKKTKTKDFPFFEAVWTKSKMVYTVYPDHIEMFVPTSKVEIQEKQDARARITSFWLDCSGNLDIHRTVSVTSVRDLL